jgi:hypothetical protein
MRGRPQRRFVDHRFRWRAARTGSLAGMPTEPVTGSRPGDARRTSVAARCSFSNCTSRLSTRRRSHPLWPSPGARRTNFFVGSSRKTPIRLDSPITVPSSTSGGRSASGGGVGLGGEAVGAAITGGGGGRRDGEKIGRSRVADKALNGTAHKGLPTGAFEAASAVALGPGEALTAAGTLCNGSTANPTAACTADAQMLPTPPSASISETLPRARMRRSQIFGGSAIATSPCF